MPAQAPIAAYGSNLLEDCRNGWNRFWLTPADPLPLSVMRIAVGLLAIYFLLSYSADLARWFAAGGLMPPVTLAGLTMQPADASGYRGPSFRFTYLLLADSPSELWALHIAGLVVLIAFTAGVFTRITAPLALLVVLSYIHRAPMITAQFETVLVFLLLYLSFGPSGTYLSFDAWLRARRTKPEDAPANHDSITANIALRFLQLHLALLVGFMALCQLGGDTWWAGEAVWWMATRTRSRLVDLTGLYHSLPTINLWTHALVAAQLAFALLVWRPLWRPVVLVLACLVWISLAMLTGLVSFAVAMAVAALAFIPAASWRRCLPQALAG